MLVIYIYYRAVLTITLGRCRLTCSRPCRHTDIATLTQIRCQQANPGQMRQSSRVASSALSRRPQIVDAAIEILERGGVESLNMRGLATELKMRPMTLYYYVPNKAALLSLVVSETAARIPWARHLGLPRDRMIAQALEVYERLSEIPWMSAVLRAGTSIGPPPLVLAESFLAAANELGLPDERSFGLWRATWFLISAELQWREADRSERAERAVHERIKPIADAVLTSTSEWPHMNRLLPQWPRFATEFSIKPHLTAMIDGTIATVHSHRGVGA